MRRYYKVTLSLFLFFIMMLMIMMMMMVIVAMIIIMITQIIIIIKSEEVILTSLKLTAPYSQGRARLRSAGSSTNHHHMASSHLTSLPTLLYPHPYRQKKQTVTHLLFLLPFSFQRMQAFTFVQLPLNYRRGRLTHTPIGRHKDGRTTDTGLASPQPCSCLMTRC